MMIETELQKAEKQLAQAKARVQAIKARQNTKERKNDTRRKIIIGSAIIDRAKNNPNLEIVINEIIQQLSRKPDIAVFENWSIR